MQNVMKLSQDDIITAIGFYLEAQGASADVGTISFAFDGKGEVLATLEGEMAEEEVDDDALHSDIAVARAQRDTTDMFTRQPILKGAPCLWIEGEGITAIHPVEWPESFKKEYPLTKEQLAYLGKKLRKSGASEASTAADILGGDDEGPLDRSSALEQGLDRG